MTTRDDKTRFLTSPQRGFTLPEVMIALVIVGLIGVGSWRLISFANINQSWQEERLAEFTELTNSFQLFSEDILYSVNRPKRINRTDESPAFSGNRDELNFVRKTVPSLSQPRTSELLLIHYRIEHNRKGERQWHRYFSRYIDGANQHSFNKQIVLSSLDTLHFEYIDSDLNIHDQWPPVNDNIDDAAEENVFPIAIRLSATSKNLGSVYKIVDLPKFSTALSGDQDEL